MWLHGVRGTLPALLGASPERRPGCAGGGGGRLSCCCSFCRHVCGHALKRPLGLSRGRGGAAGQPCCRERGSSQPSCPLSSPLPTRGRSLRGGGGIFCPTLSTPGAEGAPGKGPSQPARGRGFSCISSHSGSLCTGPGPGQASRWAPGEQEASQGEGGLCTCTEADRAAPSPFRPPSVTPLEWHHWVLLGSVYSFSI